MLHDPTLDGSAGRDCGKETDEHDTCRQDTCRQDTLSRIAQVLDCSVEELAAKCEAGPDPAETAEVLELWYSLKTPDARRMVMDVLRNAARNT